MEGGIFQFAWRVPKVGHKIIKARDVNTNEEDFFLTTGEPISTTGTIFRYAPLDHTGLFWEFAETPLDEQGIISFANRYGLLEGAQFIGIGGQPIAGGDKLSFEVDGQLVAVGDKLSLWFQEVFFAKEALALWTGIVRKDTDILSRRIVWEDGEVRYASPRVGGQRMTSLIASPQVHPERLTWMAQGDLIIPATLVLQEIVNERLAGRMSPKLLFDDEKDVKLSMYLVPKNLIGAIWLQFARAIDGNKQYRYCQECRKPFEVSPEVARSHKQYCSNACRQKAYRRRKEGK